MTLVASLLMIGVAASVAPAQASSTRASEQARHSAPRVARGTFDVKVTPLAPDAGAGSAEPGRLSLDKQLHGDLVASSKGQMLAAQTAVEGSAGYVAMELVTGTLHGRKGTFILQHIGSMKGGVAKMQIGVVPDSGTGELKGIDGTFEIIIAGEKHSYAFTYSLPSAP